MILSMEKWVGKVAVVTGASPGIGAAITEQLVSNDVILVGMACRAELIEKKAEELTDQLEKLYSYKIDLFQEEESLDAFKWIGDSIGPVSILINNAETFKVTTMHDEATEDWRAVFELNVIILSICTREAIRMMKENGIAGHIIHINSIFGHKVPNLLLNAYASSKFAVTALTETLRQELISIGLRIKIPSVSPGLVETELTTLNPNLDMRVFYDSAPILKAEDIADGVIYALSTPEGVQVHELTIKPVGEVN